MLRKRNERIILSGKDNDPALKVTARVAGIETSKPFISGHPDVDHTATGGRRIFCVTQELIRIAKTASLASQPTRAIG